MIYITDFRDRELSKFDNVYAIVRSLKSRSDKIQQLADLSPSTSLFYEYRNLANAGNWSKQTFDKIYVPKFLQQMHEPTAMNALNKIYTLSKQENLALICFCPDETLCHRSIIAGLLQGVNAHVQLPSGADYTKYYHMYQQCKQGARP